MPANDHTPDCAASSAPTSCHSSVDLVKRLEARFEPWDRLAATSSALEARGLTEEADALPGPLARGLLELGDDIRQLREVLERSGSLP